MNLPIYESTSDLPIFEPIVDSPKLTQADIDRIFYDNDPRILEARERYLQGDITVIPAISDLFQTRRDILDICLPNAVQSKNTELVEQLLEMGAKVYYRSVEIAISGGDIRALSLFARYGWNLNENLEQNYPPALSLAVGSQTEHRREVIEWFIANGAIADARCTEDVTPLSFAVQHAPLWAIEMLLDSCATVQHGQLLHHVAHRLIDDCESVCKLILDRCSFGINDIMYQNDAFSYALYKVLGLGTPLHEAARAGGRDAAMFFLRHGAMQDLRDSYGRTAAEIAQKENNIEVLRALEEFNLSTDNPQAEGLPHALDAIREEP